MANLSQRARSVTKSGIVEVENQVRLLEAKRRPVVKLHLGNTWEKTDDLLIAKAHEALRAGRTGYEAIGTCTPEFADALIEYWKRRFKVHIEREWIIAGPLTGLLNQTMDALLQPGRRASVIIPAWDLYFSQINETQATQNYVQMEYCDKNWRMPKFSGKDNDLIIVNDPNNPTASVLDEKSRQAIISAASETKASIITDLAYDQLYWDCDFKPLLQYEEIADRTIVVGTFSKSHRMGGWRMGYLISSDNALIDVLRRKVSNDWCFSPPFIQYAAAYGLSKEFESHVEEWREKVKRISKKTFDMLESFSIECADPKGTIYVFANIKQDSETFCRKLLQEHGIATVPGGTLGENAKQWIRITTVAVPEEKLYPAIEKIGHVYQNSNPTRQTVAETPKPF